MAMVGLFVIVLEIILVVVLPFVLKLNPYDSDYTAFLLLQVPAISWERMRLAEMCLPG